MQLDIEFCGTLCYTPRFIINGVNADYDDFGEKYDRDPDSAYDCGCGDMQFTRIDPTQEVLEKYKITDAEYYVVAAQLENGLSFGGCGLCS